jgi:hypothetical protein
VCDVGWFDTNGYILLVGGEFGLPSLPVNGLLPSVEWADDADGWETVEFDVVEEL